MLFFTYILKFPKLSQDKVLKKLHKDILKFNVHTVIRNFKYHIISCLMKNENKIKKIDLFFKKALSSNYLETQDFIVYTIKI